MDCFEGRKRRRINFPGKTLKTEDLDQTITLLYKALAVCIVYPKLTPSKVLGRLGFIQHESENRGGIYTWQTQTMKEFYF